jgi:hypothetical protein
LDFQRADNYLQARLRQCIATHLRPPRGLLSLSARLLLV